VVGGCYHCLVFCAVSPLFMYFYVLRVLMCVRVRLVVGSDCLLSCRTTDSHIKRITSTSCCIHTVAPPDDGLRYARNMWSLTEYTKNNLCIKFGFLCTITQANKRQHLCVQMRSL
jgi:hypothetical protein